MNKKLVIDGKKYISAKRASEIYGYNSDYIGQLCRENFFDAKRIGRAWFVAEDAIIHHKNSGIKKVAEELPKHLSPIRDVAAKTGYSTDYVSRLCRTGQVECRMVQDKWYVSEASVFQHKQAAEQKQKQRAEILKEKNTLLRKATHAVDEKNIPVAQSVSPVSSAQSFQTSPRVSSLAFRHNEYEAARVSHDESVAGLAPLFSKIIFAVLLAVVAIIPFWMIQYARPTVAGLENQSVAAVSETVDSLVSVYTTVRVAVVSWWDESRGQVKRLTFRTSRSKGAPRTEPPGTQEEGSQQGLVVIPSSASARTDEDVKDYVKSSFSDETAVTPDETGSSGIIKPIFKNHSDQEYLYVMVPLKE